MSLSNDSVVKRVAEKLNLPEDQVYIVIMDFWAGIKYYFTHPHKAKRGVMINRLLKFKLRIKRVIAYIEFLKKRSDAQSTYTVQYWSNILENLNYGNSTRKKRT